MSSISLPQPRLVFFSKSVVEPSFIESLNLALKSGAEYIYRHTDQVDEVRELVNRSTRVVWLANCATKADIAEIYPLLGAFEARILDGTLKVVLLNSAKHPKLHELVRARVGVEVVDLPTTTKSLHYKLKNLIISAHQNYLKIADVIDNSMVVGNEMKTSLRTKPRVLGAEVLWQPPTEFEFDFWWVPDGKSIRLVLGVWLIDLIGPSPAAGGWEAAPELDSKGEQAWVWKTRWLADEKFQPRDGRWVFYGKQVPEYLPEKATWLFIGAAPRLAYFKNGVLNAKYVRFEYRDEDGFLATENSATGKSLLPLIKKTVAQVPSARTEEKDFGRFDLPTMPASTDEAPTRLLMGEAESAASTNIPNDNTLGLDEFQIPGVATGARSFAKMSLGVDVVRKNGELGDADLTALEVYHVTKAGATLMLEPANAEIGDRFHFRFKFGSADALTECVMEWEMKEIEMSFEEKMLARGDFVSGDTNRLSYVLDKLDARKKELKEFYEAARG